MSGGVGVRVGVAAGVVLLLALGAGAWALLDGGRESADGPAAELYLQAALGGADTVGYSRADRPIDFAFPADHGPHPAFRTEWWYLTGNLRGEDGRRFGYQLTFFRSALAPPTADSAVSAAASAWATDQAWMGHLTVTDVAAGEFHAFERFERGALGLAGAVAPAGDTVFRVWLGPWEMRGEGRAAFPVTVRAATDTAGLALRLEPEKGIVLQGDRGWSRKGPEPGNASYYYTMPRLRTTGRVTTPAGTFDVEGSTWLDREWSTSALSQGVVGWDWFALRLEDGRDLVVYGLRQEDGTFAPWSEGLLVGIDGGTRRLERADFDIEVLGRWESPLDGTVYPAAWRITVPSAGLDLRVEPLLADQELDVAYRYWEGAVDVLGAEGERVGEGYVELTGYSGSPTRGTAAGDSG